MQAPLFDQTRQTRGGPGKRTERQFTYLNESARPDITEIRRVLERWFRRYPSAQAAELRSRFRSRRDDSHQAAFFELLLHELFLKLGFSISVHPDLPTDSSRHPDFRVEDESGQAFYVEATLALPDSESLSELREDRLLDTIDDIRSDDFFLSVEFDGTLDRDPRISTIARQIEQWLATLDAAEIDRKMAIEGSGAMPAFSVQVGTWTFRIQASPKSPARRGTTGDRAVGIGPTRGGFVDNHSPIRRAVLSKGNRYGRLDLPFVVAVNALARGVDRITEMEALFGQEQITFQRGGPGILVEPEPKFSRVRDGIWVRLNGPRYKRIDTVVIFRSAHPWSAGSAAVCAYQNPWGRRSSSRLIPKLPYAIADDDRMKWFDGESLGTILGLPEGWPGAD